MSDFSRGYCHCRYCHSPSAKQCISAQDYDTIALFQHPLRCYCQRLDLQQRDPFSLLSPTTNHKTLPVVALSRQPDRCVEQSIGILVEHFPRSVPHESGAGAGDFGSLKLSSNSKLILVSYLQPAADPWLTD
jgi:hypothetical protein